MTTNNKPLEATADHTEPGNRKTLLEIIMADALIEVIRMTEGRERMTANLHPFATRALFQATEGLLTNQELLAVLRPATTSGAVGRDTKESRNLRSIGKERGLKIGDLRRNAMSLLKNGKLSKAEIVRAWTYALIHCAALQTAREFRDTRTGLSLSTLDSNPTVFYLMLDRCYELTMASVQDEFMAATQAAIECRPDAEERRFLHFAASLVLEVMQTDRLVMATWKDLLDNVYPEIDRYTFGID